MVKSALTPEPFCSNGNRVVRARLVVVVRNITPSAVSSLGMRVAGVVKCGLAYRPEGQLPTDTVNAAHEALLATNRA